MSATTVAFGGIQIRSFGDVGSMSGLPESGHGRAIYEYMPLDHLAFTAEHSPFAER